MAPAAYGDEDILGLLAAGSLSDALASQGAIPLERRGRDGGEVRPYMGSIAETVGAASCGGSTAPWLLPHLPKGCQMLPWVLAQGELLVPLPTPTVNRACFVCLLLTGWLQLDGDLFLMPSFGGGTTTSEGGDTDAQGGPFSKRSSRGTGSGSHQQQQEEVYGGAGLMQQDW